MEYGKIRNYPKECNPDMERYLVDTNIFINHFRGKDVATNFLKERNFLYTSFVTYGELLQGVRNRRELNLVNKTMDKFDIDFGSNKIFADTMDLLNKYSLSHGLKLLDAVIAATALNRSYIVVTENIKDFKFIPDIQLEKI